MDKNNSKTGMTSQTLAQVFGPVTTSVTQKDIKGNRVSMNALFASRMIALFRRGIESRL